MKILIASDHYPPYIGGAQRQTWLLAHELQRRGHEVAVATVWQRHLPARENDDDVLVCRLRQLRTIVPRFSRPGRRVHQPPFPDPVTVLGLRRLVREFCPDVVHAAGWFGYSCAAAGLTRRVPLVLSARDYGFTCANTTLIHRGRPCAGPALGKCVGCAGAHYGRPRGWLAALSVVGLRPYLRRRISVLHSVSSYVDGVMRRDLLDGDVTPTAVVPSFRSEDEAPVGRDGSGLDALPLRPFILFVGALRVVKGIETLLAAYGGLEDPPPLVLLGTRETDTPPELPAGVTVIEALPNWAVLEAWDHSLFGVLPSLWPEPFGSVVHEGMSRRRAVVGTTPGGHTDMIEDGVTGLLVPAGDVSALREAMRRLIDDPALRNRLGAAAGVRARDFTAAAVVPQFERLYRRAVGAAPAGAR